jgi:hypothetical protein
MKPKRGKGCRTGKRGREAAVRSGLGGQEFVPVDPGRDPAPPIMGLDAHNLGEATDMDVAGHRDFPRQRENKFNGRARFKLGVNHKIQPAEADVPRLALAFDIPIGSGRANRQRERHGETARGSALCRLCHCSPGRELPKFPHTVTLKKENRNGKQNYR